MRVPDGRIPVHMDYALQLTGCPEPRLCVLNTAGGAILAYIALRPLQVGFAVMETTWTVVSMMALYRAVARRRTPA